ncbi:hypothetical protein V1512DRAFT_256199 [Lipomyces arxii]|uniref:uncharacterized protein n=1 Tax=Lipomyces arxii TaxID=56418 RepID=UPI0034CDDACC
MQTVHKRLLIIFSIALLGGLLSAALLLNDKAAAYANAISAAIPLNQPGYSDDNSTFTSAAEEPDVDDDEGLPEVEPDVIATSFDVIANQQDPVEATQNATLGFGELILLSLEYRTDRQDAIALISSLCGMKVSHMVPGVRFHDINEKAYPGGDALSWLVKPKSQQYLGSWRSHMNAFKYIVENRIESALLIEDDVDWDINIKHQLRALSQALRSSPIRAPLSPDEAARAPYGLDWDIIHFGPSKANMAPQPRDKVYTAYNDPYRASTAVANNACSHPWFCWSRIMSSTGLNETERVIFPTFETVGLSAIAISYRGAQKLLYQLSFKELTNTLDLSMAKLVQQGQLRGWTVIPPLMSEFKTRGQADSDLKSLVGSKRGRGNLQGKSAGVAHSARKALTEQLENGDYWVEEKKVWQKIIDDREPAATSS